MDINFLVRVGCMTFNHAPYIEDAMNGFCIQETSFPFVCTIIDDASTDGEPEVIKRYLQDNFDFDNKNIIRNEETDDYVMTFAQHKTNKNCYFAVYFLKYNHYGKKSKIPYIKEWQDQVKYIALCEGDDYWTDSHKLDVQVKYLENHQDCGLIWGKAKTYTPSDNKYGGSIGGNSPGFDSLLLKNEVVTLTAVYRKGAMNGYEDYIGEKKWLMGDYPHWLYISMNYKIKFINRVFGVYRVLQNSASLRSSYENRVKLAYSAMDCRSYFAERNNPFLCKTIEQNFFMELFELSYNEKKYEKVLYYYKKMEKHSLRNFMKRLYSTLFLNLGK